MDLPARYLNHVCDTANVGIRVNAQGAYDFVALRHVSIGEEVLWDYECSEYELDHFVCKCESPSCRGILRGYRVHGQRVLDAYGWENVAPYLFTEPPE